jgi:hypothetical protein
MSDPYQGQDQNAEPEWLPWSEFPPEDLKDQIEAKLHGAGHGQHVAVLVKVENPITGYRLPGPSGD